MSTTAKVAFVREVKDEHGLAPALAAMELPRSTWYYHQQKVSYAEKYAPLRPLLEQIAREHPEYGVRRTVVELREVYGQVVNHKVVRRLHQLWELALLRTTQPPRPNPLREIIVQAGDRANLVAQLAEIPPLTVLCTDFTEIRYANGQRKAYFMPLLDHAGKFVYGWSLSPSANRTAALAAWQAARETLEHLQVSCQGLIVHHDQDTVYTSYAWTGQLLHADNVRLSYSLNGARGNTEMESFFSRFKSEGASRFLVADDFAELLSIVGERVAYHNYDRRHSTLDYRTPIAVLQDLCPAAARLPVDSVDNRLRPLAHPAHSPAATGWSRGED